LQDELHGAKLDVNHLTVGGATVAVAAEGRARWSTTRLARCFSRDLGRPRLSLEPAPLAAAPPVQGRTTFESGRGWWVSESEDGFTVSFWDDHLRPTRRRRKVLTVDPAWTRGTLYLPPELADSNGHRFWLWYPLEHVMFTSLLGRSSGAVVHASAIVRDGYGWVFAGTHGAGKSTTAALFAGRADAVVLSDDRVVLRRIGGVWRVFGTPWPGTVLRASPTSAPIAGIFFLRHGGRTERRPLPPATAAPRLLARCFLPYWDRRALTGLLETVTDIARDVPCYDFPFVPEPDAIIGCLTAAHRPNAL
jgi:hypothetical protein